MAGLSIDYANVSGIRLSSQEQVNLAASVVVPTPNKLVLEEYDWQLPVDEDNLPRTFQEFLDSSAGKEWSGNLTPLEDRLFPVSFKGDRQELANALLANGLNVVLVHNEEDNIMGFMVTSFGHDVSDQICAAYILAGHLPPYRLLLNVVDIPEPVMEDALYEAMDQHAEYWSAISERFRTNIEAKKSIYPVI